MVNLGFRNRKNVMLRDQMVTEAPTQRSEDWRYFRLDSLLDTPFETKLSGHHDVFLDQISKILGEKQLKHAIVLINGELSESHANFKWLPKGVSVECSSISHAPKSSVPDLENPFENLNTARAKTITNINVKAGAIIDEPVHVILCTAGNVVSYPRISVSLEKASTLQLALTHVSLSQDNPQLDNPVIRLSLAEEAKLAYINIKDGDQSSYVLDHTEVIQHGRSDFNATYIAMKGQAIRNEMRVYLKGEEANCVINGLGLLNKESQLFAKTLIHHEVPSCESAQTFKNILANGALSEYNGLVKVFRDAQKTLSNQLNRNLLLDDSAKAYSRPQLRILADDVKCTHGSTNGQLEENEILYLTSRGLSEADARSLLIYGFAEEIIQAIPIKPIRDQLASKIKKQLASLS